jgi:hypothetical protein
MSGQWNYRVAVSPSRSDVRFTAAILMFHMIDQARTGVARPVAYTAVRYDAHARR